MQKFASFFHTANIFEHGTEFFQFDLFGIKAFIAYFLLQLLIAGQSVRGKYSVCDSLLNGTACFVGMGTITKTALLGQFVDISKA